MRPAEIKSILNDLKVVPTKGKGQNFLTDDEVARREVDALDIVPGGSVLEVGPGLGVLTHFLVERSERVFLIELDQRMASFIASRYEGRMELIQGDALKVDWPRFDKFISNVPYNISSPLIFKLLEHDFQSAVIMVQKEFADRMVAEPDSDDYSRLTVNVYYRAACERLEHVPRNRFWPEPEVDSSVIRLVPRPPPFAVHDERLFFRLVEMLFQQRRKKIGTVLKRSHLIALEQVRELPFLDDRVEALSPEEIGELSNQIAERKK
jgi:16S rRNA (adenine1518-N6/adenine1519-N6)-dimethyltransferase